MGDTTNNHTTQPTNDNNNNKFQALQLDAFCASPELHCEGQIV